ncbi:MAG: hypothetical protein KatS3mg057_2677 [Herpetosiphonaceae bacterium]|nr:MAG: hypothetical protein KatS3mg057_2677 [Herpetosiphonaceae bacterium]
MATLTWPLVIAISPAASTAITAGVLTDTGWRPSNSGDKIAWGDVDNDGDLDLAMQGKIFLNKNNALSTAPDWTAPLTDDPTASIAWGDADNDGDLDLAVGNYSESDPRYRTARIYRNDTPPGALTPTMTLAWSADEFDRTVGIAWGDVDNDGDLDLATGISFGPNRLYRNEGTDSSGNLRFRLIWTAKKRDAHQKCSLGLTMTGTAISTWPPATGVFQPIRSVNRC